MPTPEQESAIDQQITSGRMINAIRLYREATQASLPEAKNWVERRAATLRGTAPPPPTSQTSIFAVQKPAWSATGGGRTVIGLVILALVITIVVVVLRSNLVGVH